MCLSPFGGGEGGGFVKTYTLLNLSQFDSVTFCIYLYSSMIM
jgi:hypothetical protein